VNKEHVFSADSNHDRLEQANVKAAFSESSQPTQLGRTLSLQDMAIAVAAACENHPAHQALCRALSALFADMPEVILARREYLTVAAVLKTLDTL
jgi:hypothetical protein